MTREELLAAYKEEVRDFAKEVLRFQEELDAKFFDSWAEHLFNLAEKLQPALPAGLEADLEKEIIRYQREDMDRDTTDRDIARHFYELGKDSKVSGENGKNFTIGR